MKTPGANDMQTVLNTCMYTSAGLHIIMYKCSPQLCLFSTNGVQIVLQRSLIDGRPKPRPPSSDIGGHTTELDEPLHLVGAETEFGEGPQRGGRLGFSQSSGPLLFFETVKEGCLPLHTQSRYSILRAMCTCV